MHEIIKLNFYNKRTISHSVEIYIISSFVIIQ